jgi:predicted RNA binding protein YcfA (HicA-like mRNA interferase family)
MNLMPMKVREIMRLLQDHGWIIERQKGSHRQMKHTANPNVLTIAGKDSGELRPGTLQDILKKAGLRK